MKVELTYAEAFVLSDLLHRWERDRVELPLQDHAEQVALWNLLATLEPLIGEALSDNYEETLQQMRSALRST